MSWVNFLLSFTANADERLFLGSTPLDYLHTLGHTGMSKQRLKSYQLTSFCDASVGLTAYFVREHDFEQ